MCTLRELQTALAGKIEEVRQRDLLIDELEAELDEKDALITSLQTQLEKYRAAMKTSIAVAARQTNNGTLGRQKRTAISAESTTSSTRRDYAKLKRHRKPQS